MLRRRQAAMPDAVPVDRRRVARNSERPADGPERWLLDRAEDVAAVGAEHQVNAVPKHDLPNAAATVYRRTMTIILAIARHFKAWLRSEPNPCDNCGEQTTSWRCFECQIETGSVW